MSVICKLCNKAEALDNNSLCEPCNDFLNKSFPEFSTDPHDFHIDIVEPNIPKWTVMYSTPGEGWEGCAWEFFNTKEIAIGRAEQLVSSGQDVKAVSRPFDFFRDIHALRKTWQK